MSRRENFLTMLVDKTLDYVDQLSTYYSEAQAQELALCWLQAQLSHDGMGAAEVTDMFLDRINVLAY